jgi:hypothetical protein
MGADRPKSARTVVLADHVWEVFEEMAESLGSERDALINQAMFMFARLNGFLETPASRSRSAKWQVSTNIPPPPGTTPLPSSPDHQLNGPTPQPQVKDDPERRQVAERVLETAAELERLIQNKSQAEYSAATAMLEPTSETGEPGADQQENGLFVVAEDGHSDRITKDRFVIGRGKHCDYVISSGKVSREHAVILRQGDEYYIEDLGSSNGTWFNRQRIQRRKVDDGDEYFICSDKIKLVIR